MDGVFSRSTRGHSEANVEMLPQSMAAQYHNHPWTVLRKSLTEHVLRVLKHDFKSLSAIRGKTVTTVGMDRQGQNNEPNLTELPSFLNHESRKTGIKYRSP